jgi:predicted amidohydrolase YtcJ
MSDDLFSIPPVRIRDVKVLTTIAGGRIVYQR